MLLAHVLFPGRQVQDARHLGRYGPEEQFLWHVQDWFHWLCCTSRCFRFPGLKAHDARHHGPYGPG